MIVERLLKLSRSLPNDMILKVFYTGIGMLLSLYIGLFVPRQIGVESYGFYTYITSTFAFLFQIFLFSSNTAYVYHLAKAKFNRTDINKFYLLYLSVVSVIVFLIFIFDSSLGESSAFLLKDFDSEILYLGFIYSLFFFLQQRSVDYADATESSVATEQLKFFSRCILVMLLVLIQFYSQLDLIFFYYVLILSLTIYFIFFISRNGFIYSFKFVKGRFTSIFKSFLSFILPLLPYALITSLYAYSGRYAIQYYSGSVEQGYYGFAFQLVMVPVAIIFAISNLFMKKALFFYERRDFKGLESLFTTIFSSLYLLFSVFIGLLLIYREMLIEFVVGIEFMGASDALFWLSFYALAHTFGVLNSNLFYISGRNKQYSISAGLVAITAMISLLLSIIFVSITAEVVSLIVATAYIFKNIIQMLMNFNFFGFSYARFFKAFMMVSFLSSILLILIVLGINYLG